MSAIREAAERLEGLGMMVRDFCAVNRHWPKSEVKRRTVDLMEQLANLAIDAAIEEACAVWCSRCRKEIPLANGQYHVSKTGRRTTCYAIAIRSLSHEAVAERIKEKVENKHGV